MNTTLQAVRGMNDILPDEAELWESMEAILREWLQGYGYRNLRTPLLEQTALFHRAIGAATDIVEKEMYSFVDALNEEHLTLRPEATASTVRSAIQHSLTYNGPQRLYYMGPMFRHERPQKGRYRQFHQVGAEALGMSGPDIDAEQLLMCSRLWDDLGIHSLRLHLNSLGSAEERSDFRNHLVAFLRNHSVDLDDDSRRRLETNPLRVLDSKNAQMQEIILAAPKLMDYLGTESIRHFESVQGVLKDAGIPYEINPRLVRGLDYYNLTVFEWVTDSLGAQGTVCGGGRYDGLFGQIGGKPTPACGWAIGIERLLALVAEEGRKAEPSCPDVYVVSQGEAAVRYAFSISERLRDTGLAVIQHCGGGSFKSQMKKADASRAILALIVGDDEVASGAVNIKPLREGREQATVPFEHAPQWISDFLYSESD